VHTTPHGFAAFSLQESCSNQGHFEFFLIPSYLGSVILVNFFPILARKILPQ